MISKRGFYRFLRTLQPTPYEAMNDTSYRTLKDKSTNYIVFNEARLYHAVASLLRFVREKEPAICDFGVFPGTLVHILSELLPKEGMRPRFYGAGLLISDEFKGFMATTYAAEIFTTNLDPSNPDLAHKQYATKVSLPDNSLDAAFATEIIEHMTNPHSLLREMHRLLKPGGIAVVTTPNVTRIGCVFKLLAGISNYDRLMPVGYSNPDDEWRPHFREYAMKDLSALFASNGFEVLETRHFLGDQTVYNVKSLKQRAVDLLKAPFYLVPHLRDALLVAARKLPKE